MGIKGARDFPPGPVLQSQVLDGPVDGSAGSRVLSEAGHPRDLTYDYYARTLASFWGPNEWLLVDFSRVSRVQIWTYANQDAAVADGSIEVRDNFGGLSFVPDVTIPQGTYVAIDGVVMTKDAGSSGVAGIAPRLKSGEDGTALKMRGAVIREVLS